MKRVLLGMSGGVDSSVSALLLQKMGYEVVGATMILFEDPNIEVGCLSNSAVLDAKKVCDKLNIEHHVINLKDDFKNYVINNFIDSYKKGFTPNPCVECNKYLKFGKLYEEALKLNCDYIATGHYASIRDGKLVKSKEEHKDQTYFLYGIKKEILDKIIFPLADFSSKEEIRKIAEENDLIVARKKDSQEICFIPNDDYKSYLKNNNVKNNPGNFILDGEIIEDTAPLTDDDELLDLKEIEKEEASEKKRLYRLAISGEDVQIEQKVKKEKAKMSFFTAFMLSAKNLINYRAVNVNALQ